MDGNKLYQKGFNEGYIITKHLPDLSQKLAGITAQTPRMEGFRDGRQQFVMEKMQDRQPSWMKGRAKTSGKDKTKDKGIEPDR